MCATLIVGQICLWFLLGIQTISAQELIQKLSISECLEIAKQKEFAGDIKEATRFLNQAALIHWENKEYEPAIEIFQRSLALNISINNLHGAAGINSNLGMIYADLGNYEKSLECFQKVLAYRRTRNDKVSIISALINASVVLNNLKRHAEAAEFLEEALVLARELNDADQMKSCYGMLSETYEKAGNTERSIHYFNLYRSFHELVQKEKVKKYEALAEESRLRAELLAAQAKNQGLELLLKNKIIQEQKYQIINIDAKNRALLESKTKQELIIAVIEREKEIQKIEAQRKQEAAQAELQAASLMRNIFMGGFLAAGLFAFTIYRNYRQKKKINSQLQAQNIEIKTQGEKILQQKLELEKAYQEIHRRNIEITDSIHYAQRIQAALLTDKDNIKKYIPHSFIFFRPLHIVSGDFYWFSQTSDYDPRPGRKLIAAVDCTGHGVPGALMSMIGYNMLNQLVQQHITRPDLMLTHLHHSIKNVLHIEQTQVRDGMDMVLISIDEKQEIIEFAGANNSLYYVVHSEVNEIKGDKRAIGSILEPKEGPLFTLQTLPIVPGLAIYMGSDGVQDQFGGPEGKKFMRKRLCELFVKISHLPVDEQLQALEETIDNWMGKYSQVDDMLIIGLKF
ncbi:MAG: tetratricopeptide repeat protein [Bacteroidia bacterium]|nr:tetratricopeptide repeat protein [Bacteroidia bacterium]MDW8159130.1 tetratricopeptide repeat protein [Bacteroidia bacterium]